MRINLLITLTSLTLLIIIILIIIILCYRQDYIFNVNELDHEQISDEIIIETNNGNTKGFRKREAGFEFYQFLGIPYAQPPINQNRFRGPKPITQKWTDNYVADRWPDFCKQINLKQYEYLTPIINYKTSEDCLYLNIWTPFDVMKKRSDTLRPVIVYIHGGAFMYMGTSFDIFNGAVISSLGDVVFITINYRVGIFGFLDTGAEELETDDQNSMNVPKNIGLLDQIMALNWVKDNIKYFGGDPNCVTLMGQSAGAISIGLLMATPEANHLFVRAILESASPMQMKFFYQISQTNYKRVLQLTNCSGIQCLRELNENDLNAVHEILSKSLTSFSPAIPSQLLPQFPREAFDINAAENDIKQKQILLGSNSEEGAIFLHHIRPEQFPLDQLPDIDGEGVLQLFKELGSDLHNMSDSQLKMLINNTLGINGNTPAHIRQQLSILIGDFLFKCPVIKMAESLSEWPNVTLYMYYFTERSGNWPQWIGSSHFEEVQFVFGFPLRYPHNYSIKQQEFTRRLIKTWTEFARSGKMLAQLGKEWPKYCAESGQHMELNSDRSSIGVKLNQSYYLLYEIGFETI